MRVGVRTGSTLLTRNYLVTPPGDCPHYHFFGATIRIHLGGVATTPGTPRFDGSATTCALHGKLPLAAFTPAMPKSSLDGFPSANLSVQAALKRPVIPGNAWFEWQLGIESILHSVHC
jgi:hypothetical protein